MENGRRMFLLPALMVGIGLLLAACGAVSTETLSPLSSPISTAPPEPTAGIEELVKQDLAGRLGISAQAIRLVSKKAVEWGDTSLGCPQPGMVYAQVVTPGYEIVLEAGGKQYDYHSGGDSFVLCEKPQQAEPPAAAPGQPSPNQPDARSAPLVEQARQDLAGRLGIALEGVRVTSVEAVQWRNSSLGCPKPGMMYLQVITPGYLIKLEAGSTAYEYHTSETLVVYCDKPEPPLSSEGGS